MGTQETNPPAAALSSETLRLKLESPLPRELPAGQPSAIFCAGVCFDRLRAVELELVIDGMRHRPSATGMPRPDVFAADGHPSSYRSGWWTTLPLAGSSDSGQLELQAAVRVDGGTEQLFPLGRLDLGPAAQPTQPDVAGETIAVCMATYNPAPGLFETQVRSLIDQTDRRWMCVISDDCSDEAQFEHIQALVDSDPRFVVSRSERRLGFYRNFERALKLAPEHARLVALCDQDDRWHPDKLETLRTGLGTAQMVYSDQRLVDEAGRVLRETMWRGRSNNHTNLASMLVANTVTGAAMLFRRDLLDLALPFPDTPGLQFHDHWLALVALAAGQIAYVDRPLYDYVQHPGAIFGQVTHHRRRSAAPRSRFRRWRAAYFCGYLSREVQAQVLLCRCSARLKPGKRRALERYVASQRSPLWFAWLLLRPLRRLLGRNETLGSELELVPGIAWRWLISPLGRWSAFTGRRRADATYPNPLDFEQGRLRRWRARIEL